MKKGLENGRKEKRSRASKGKKPWNKKMYIGFGLLVGGYLATMLLFSIYAPLIIIGNGMIVAGIIFLGRGIAQRNRVASKPARTINITTTNSSGKTPAKPESCRKDIAIKGHEIDGEKFCHANSLREYGNVDFDADEEKGLTVADAAKILRNQIMEEITKTPAVKYQLASLLWQDAANCFYGQWDGAWFKLDLQTGTLSADVSTYPNQYGACREDTFPLSAWEFHRIAKRFHMSKELQAFQSDEDWGKLFDDNLKAAVSTAFAAVQKKNEDRKKEAVQNNAVKIPAKYTNLSPDMCLSEITIEISQRYSNRSIQVSNQNGKYTVVYVRNSHMSPSVDRYPRTLSAAEAVWLEKQIVCTINNPDESTWQSLPGGDTMNITIKRRTGKDISLKHVKPIKKYSDLQTALEKLAQYGSRPEH